MKSLALFPILLLLIACGGGGNSVAPAPGNSPSTSAGQSQSQLTVQISGSGTGNVTSNPPGITCGQSCTGDFANGTTVTLIASAASDGSVFSGWSGSCSGNASCSVVVNGTNNATATFSATLHSIHHIIYMLKENRSFDNYFGQLNAYRQRNSLPANVDGLPPGASNPDASGAGTVPAFHMKSVCAYSTTVNWFPSHIQRNRYSPFSSTGTMDGFVLEAAWGPASPSDPNGLRAMGYYDDTDIPYYYFMATQFATSDRWFSPVMSRTIPNRLYALSATSAGWTYEPTGNLNNKTIFQLLDENAQSWKIYEPANYTYLEWFQPYESQHTQDVFPISQYYADVQNQTLPAVAFIESNDTEDEHPGNNLQIGAASTAKII